VRAERPRGRRQPPGVLDPGAPKLAALVPGAPKLVEIDLATDQVVRTIRFDTKAAPEGSYLNDVRVDSAKQVAYLTDSGLGALLVIDLKTGTTRRLLEDHPSTKAEADVVPKVEGKELRVLLPDGTPGPVPQVHADGIALDLGNDRLYFCALTSRTLYKVKASLLADPKTTKEASPRASRKSPTVRLRRSRGGRGRSRLPHTDLKAMRCP
jgi:sugar lactone lactonase YvrE